VGVGGSKKRDDFVFLSRIKPSSEGITTSCLDFNDERFEPFASTPAGKDREAFAAKPLGSFRADMISGADDSDVAFLFCKSPSPNKAFSLRKGYAQPAIESCDREMRGNEMGI
jgi:hypothetical protein